MQEGWSSQVVRLGGEEPGEDRKQGGAATTPSDERGVIRSKGRPLL